MHELGHEGTDLSLERKGSLNLSQAQETGIDFLDFLVLSLGFQKILIDLKDKESLT